jgi:glycosyltransferase involved in cell wall biosynthesis
VLRRLCLWAEWATFRTADRVIATNQSYREIAIRRGGVAAERVYVVRSGPSRERFRPGAPRPELKNGRAHLVVYLGVMGPNDGLSHLLEAIDHVVHRLHRNDVQFVLIGSGDRHASTVAESRARRLENFVSFAGRVPDDAVLAYLSTADVCVAPDPKDVLNDVSTMNKIVEYMAVGKPIVAFDLREARVSAADAAVYVPPNDAAKFGDAIVELLAAPERRQRMGASGRLRFETSLAWEHQVQTLLALYRDLLASP